MGWNIADASVSGTIPSLKDSLEIKLEWPLMNSADNFMSFGEIPNMSLDFFVFIFKSNLCTYSGSTSFKKKLCLFGFFK